MENLLGDKVIDIIRFYTVIAVLVIGFINIIEEIYGWLVTVDPNNKGEQYALLIIISLALISNITWWIVEHFHRK